METVILVAILITVILGFIFGGSNPMPQTRRITYDNLPDSMKNPYDAPCVHKEFCGGCTYNGEPYSVALKAKENEVKELLKEKANSEFEDEYAGIQGCPYKWQFKYRNKMEYTFGDLTKGGEMELGMHKKGNFMSIITVDHCQLVPWDFNIILNQTLQFAKASGLKHYNKKTHEGFFRNLIIRRGIRTGELLVDLVTSSEGIESFDAAKWKDEILNLKLEDKVVGIMHTVNDNIADAVNCDEQRILFGRDYYYEEICGLRFKVNIFSFFQTNVEAIERLYQEAVALLPDLEGKTVYDLFCGTGTISQIVAKSAKEVIGVEIVRDSVEAAEVNVKLNEIDNCSFVCGDVFDVLSRATDGNDVSIDLPKPDVIIVDPPRVGLRTKTVNKIASYGVPEILYISCNPKTLAMDIADFKLVGYEPTYIKAYDNFPWTKHIEAVVSLSKLNTEK